MQYEVVAMYDRAVGAYGRPAFVQSIGVALRGFQDEVNRAAADNQVHAHPEDFDLFHLGTYNEETGKFENLDSPVQIVQAKTLVLKREA